MNVWEFIKIKPNRFSEKNDLDPDALYSWEVSNVNNERRTGSSFHFRDVKLLMKNFFVATPEELVGKKFKTPDNYNEACIALDYFLLSIKKGGLYTPPTTEELHERAFASLSEMKCPDFSDVDDQTVFQAFHPMFKKSKLKEKWFEIFKQKVAEKSNEEVKIKKYPIEKESTHILGPATFLLLEKGDLVIKFIFGPYGTPFEFCK